MSNKNNELGFNVRYNLCVDDDGDMYINIPENAEDKPEDKFFVVEITKYLFNNVFQNKIQWSDEISKENFETTIRTLEVVSDQMAGLLREQYKSTAKLIGMVNTEYLFEVDSFEELKDLPENILRDGFMVNKFDGLKVKVKGGAIYTCLTNNEWVQI
jgi:hypothetical protein